MSARATRLRGARSVCLSLLLVTLIGSLAVGPGFGQPRSGGDASMAIFGAPGSVLFPLFTSTNFSLTVAQTANRTLISYSPNLQMQPDMAQSWKISPDGRTYTFTLRPGLRWSDGAPITSADFEYTALVLSSSQTNSNWFQWVAGISGAAARKAGKSDALPGFKVVNARVFQVTTDTPSSSFLDLFGTELMPAPAHSLRAIPLPQVQKSDFARVPTVSSGPFAISDYQTDTLVTMTRNPVLLRPPAGARSRLRQGPDAGDGGRATGAGRTAGHSGRDQRRAAADRRRALEARPGSRGDLVPEHQHRDAVHQLEAQAAGRRAGPPGDGVRDQPRGDRRQRPAGDGRRSPTHPSRRLRPGTTSR